MTGETAVIFGLLTNFIATVSPGPATLAIMATSAGHGRSAGLKLAAGVMSGSLFWGLCAAFGLATVMSQFSQFFYFVKILGGCYLLWLAYKSFRSALSDHNPMPQQETGKLRNFYGQGLAIHLANPKAVLAWVAIYTVGVKHDSSGWHVAVMFFGCAMLGICVFFGYALLFSTPKARSVYNQARRPIGFLLGSVFGFAGLKLVLEPS